VNRRGPSRKRWPHEMRTGWPATRGSYCKILHCITHITQLQFGRFGRRGLTRSPQKNAFLRNGIEPANSTYHWYHWYLEYRKYVFAECGSPLPWRLELRPLAGMGAGPSMARGTAQPCRCKLPGHPARSPRPDIQEIFAEAPDLGPAVQHCITPLTRGHGHSRIIVSIVRAFRTQGRNNCADAPRNAVVPLPDRRFARRTA
jgi:hypothetical protein